jgi:hypothetical protein
MKTQYIVIKDNEPVIESIVKDVTTFGFLIFCITISKDSPLWTIICIVMFLGFFLGMCIKDLSGSCKEFKTRKELAAWASRDENTTEP